MKQLDSDRKKVSGAPQAGAEAELRGDEQLEQVAGGLGDNSRARGGFPITSSFYHYRHDDPVYGCGQTFCSPNPDMTLCPHCGKPLYSE